MQDDIPELAEIDENLVTFDGPKDPLNPKNWPNRKKWIATGIVTVYTFLSPFASSILVSQPVIDANRSRRQESNKLVKSLVNQVSQFSPFSCLYSFSLSQ